jgi:hypothetical protein
MTVRVSGRRVATTPVSDDDAPAAREARPSRFATLLDRVDAATSREEAGDAELVLLQTFAVVWAVVGYVVWMTMWLVARVVVGVWRFVARRARRDDDDAWTTTMRRRGRAG